MKIGLRLSAASISVVLACSAPVERPSDPRPDWPGAEEVQNALSGLTFDEYLDRSFERLLERSPEAVVELGLEDTFDIGRNYLDDLSPEFVEETREIENTLLVMLRVFDRNTLSRAQQTAFDAYEWYLDDQVRGHAFADHRYRIAPVINSADLSTELFFTDVHPLRDAADAEQYVRRLWDIEIKFRALEETLLRQERAGIIEPRVLIEWSRSSITRMASTSPHSTSYFQALLTKFPSIDAELLDRAADIIEVSVLPAYRSLDAQLARLEMIAPGTVGVWQHPGGDDYYAYTLRHHTTKDVTADELHQLGIDELARIHAEMEEKFRALGYPEGETIAQKIARVAADGGSVPGSRVVSEYEAIIDDAETRLDAAFDIRPSADVIVRGGPTGGFYVGPSLDGSRPGAFFAAVGGNEPRFAMRSLAYHEAIPGHHFQIGVARDLDLPLFQRITDFTGYVEGWGLYAEWLAGDLGWYADDQFGDIGRLQAEAFRAARLVVDTGIHQKQWSFDRAVTFFRDNVGFGEGAAQNQIARYASWPGQATAYSTGMIAFRAARQRAEAELGMGFDLRAFHRAVLLHGSLPLSVMERVVADELGHR